MRGSQIKASYISISCSSLVYLCLAYYLNKLDKLGKLDKLDKLGKLDKLDKLDNLDS